MKKARVSASRRAVYELIVDGVAPGTGLSPARVQEALEVRGIKMSRQRVYRHVKELEKDGYIRRIRGTRSPALYERGKMAAILDSLANPSCQPLCQPPNGGGPIVHYSCKGDNNASSGTQNAPSDDIIIIDNETHINGRYIYPVTHIGELYSPFRVRCPDTGELSEVTVWQDEPSKLKGVNVYTGTVPLHGGVTVQYYEGQTEHSLHIYPTSVPIIPGQPGRDEADLAAKAQDVANWMGRFGGWSLGIPRFVSHEGPGGGFHRAINDPAITGNFPKGYQPPESSGWYLDSTPGPISLETTGPGSAARADAVVNFQAITEDITQAHAALSQQVQDSDQRTMAELRELYGRSELLAGITGNLQRAMESMTAAQTHLIEQHAREALEKIEQLGQEADNGGMFA